MTLNEYQNRASKLDLHCSTDSKALRLMKLYSANPLRGKLFGIPPTTVLKERERSIKELSEILFMVQKGCSELDMHMDQLAKISIEQLEERTALLFSQQGRISS